MPGENGPNIGTELLKDLVRQLVLSNENAAANRELLIELRDELDELNCNFDVLNRAVEILDDVRATKKHLSVSDFISAWSAADAESRDEDEPDQGDPVVGAER